MDYYPRLSLSDLADSDVSSASDSAKKSNTRRDRQFVIKHGSKLHAYDPAEAPWPFSYDQGSLEVQMLDNCVTATYPGAVSLVDLKGKEPSRSLDLGTGLGLWAIQSAKYWRNSTFVGYDLVDIQIPLCTIPPDDACRIEWVHGNILTEGLPFKDDEFDHVRAVKFALGIPENKWTAVFEEVRRVMKPGATIEMIEEDAIFPVLPRWFTEPLHARTRWPSMNTQDDPKFFSNPQVASNPEVVHEYEFLEILFNRVFDGRFINTRPSSTLPAYFSTYFTHVVSPPVLTVPMPPLPAVQRRPAHRASQSSRLSDSSSGERAMLYDSADENVLSLATLPNKIPHNPKSGSVQPGPPAGRALTGPTASPRMQAHTMATPLARSQSVNTARIVRTSSVASIKSVKASGNGNAHTRSPSSIAMPPPPLPEPAPAPPDSGRRSVESRSTRSSEHSHASSPMAAKRAAMIRELAAVSTTIGERSQIEVFPLDALLMFDMHALCLHLRVALGFVVGAREAMWEELVGLVKAATAGRSEVDLDKYGFFPHEDTMESMRDKFVRLVKAYESDMHVRMSLWHSLVHFGWDYPQRDPMSKAEEMEELRLREDIIVARRKAGVENEREPPCRSVRIMVGGKPL